MNMATAFVLVIVIAIIAMAAYGTYSMVKNHTYCADCPKRDECCGRNPINCTIRTE